MSNGVSVRSVPIALLGSCASVPTESMERYFAPSNVLILIAKVL